jgi:hypothetical protein
VWSQTEATKLAYIIALLGTFWQNFRIAPLYARHTCIVALLGTFSQNFCALAVLERLACIIALLGTLWQNFRILPLYARLACIVALLGTTWQKFSDYRSDYLVVVLLLALASAFAASLCAYLSRVKRYPQQPKRTQNEDLGTSVGHPSDLGKTMRLPYSFVAFFAFAACKKVPTRPYNGSKRKLGHIRGSPIRLG